MWSVEAVPVPRSKTKTTPLERAFTSAVRRFLNRKTVTGVDIGYKITDGKRTPEIAIRLHVEKKRSLRSLTASQRFPKTIGGFPVDVIQAVYEDQNAFLQSRLDPVRPGASIGLGSGGVGTLGMVVSDNRRSGALGFVTAAHVLFGGTGIVGDPILQPAVPDGGSAADRAGFVARAFHASDAALAIFDNGRTGEPEAALSSVEFTAPREPRIGEVLEKIGRSTGQTRGLIDGIGHYMGVRDSFRLVGLDATPIVAPGDSGAVWYDPITGAAVGLHCKGPLTSTATSNYAIAAKVTVVARKLAVTVI